MNHEQWSWHLLRYFYQELEGEELLTFERHLSECEICQKELKELKTLCEKISELKIPQPAPEIIKTILTQAQKNISPETKPFFSLKPRIRWIAWSVAGILLMVSLMVLSLWFVRIKTVPVALNHHKVNETTKNIERESPEEEELGFVMQVSDAELFLEEIEEEVLTLNFESEPEGEGFEVLEQEVLELEELGEGIWEL